MTRAAPNPSRDRPRPIPLEANDGGPWLARCRKTLVALTLRPWQSFEVCPEPIDHGRVMRLLATLRLPPWIVLLVALAVQQATAVEGTGIPMRAIYVVIEPPLARVLSLWIVLMIPVGLPLLYFVSGLIAHIGVAVTGGASRSIGASMRACGYALGLALLVVGVVDIPLYLGRMPGEVYLVMLGVMGLVFWGLSAIALARTHRIALARGCIASLLPTVVFVAATFGRAMLELSEIPGLPPPGNGYALP
ncbi:MAG: hypothetical protein K0V04_29070 [Deltaproteobacteria bacterium]|nr:hypothetical protein [Deltaproteobacteria bacterium]